MDFKNIDQKMVLTVVIAVVLSLLICRMTGCRCMSLSPFDPLPSTIPTDRPLSFISGSPVWNMGTPIGLNRGGSIPGGGDGGGDGGGGGASYP